MVGEIGKRIAEGQFQFGTDPYTGPSGIFGGSRPDFRGFPWSELQLLAVPPDPW